MVDLYILSLTWGDCVELVCQKWGVGLIHREEKHKQMLMESLNMYKMILNFGPNTSLVSWRLANIPSAHSSKGGL